MRFPIFFLLAAGILTGCSQHTVTGTIIKNNGVLGTLRPKAASNIMPGFQQGEQADVLSQKSSLSTEEQTAYGMGRILPKVSIGPIAPPAEEIVHSQATGIPIRQMDQQNKANSSEAKSDTSQIATYNDSSKSVPATGGLVPPPPAVSLSAQAQMVAYGPKSNDPSAFPYGPYGFPYPPQWYPGQPGSMPTQGQMPGFMPSRAPGSLFGNGAKAPDNNDDDNQVERKKRVTNFVPITPTGMESRSAYKQRDDMKVLWKGALASVPVQRLVNDDDKLAQALQRIDVNLPNEATKGSFSTSSRQVDAFFRSNVADKRMAPLVRKLQSDLVQGYYRYLYAYNRFALTQQTVAARKQEVEVADTAAEQQRAAADLAQAQNDSEGASDDMRSAQLELASVASAAGARTIIGRVSGVMPSLEFLSQNDNTDLTISSKTRGGALGALGSVGSLFKFYKHGDKETKPAMAPSKDTQSVESVKVAKLNAKKAQKPKEKNEKADKHSDLSPAPHIVATNTDKQPAPQNKETTTNSAGISFMLKNVNITNRKSILTVAIHNHGSTGFSFSPEVISISENNHKLSDASVRADFDTNYVQPNQEIKGTITIFGRPWNDRLSVCISDGEKNIQMRR